MSVFETASDKLAFGDVCDADFLFDVYVDRSTTDLYRKDAQANGWWKKQLPEGVPETFPFWVAYTSGAGQEVLASGTRVRAVCLSDDCIIETALYRGDSGQRRRRLLFAPFIQATAAEADAYEKAPASSRLLVPDGDAAFFADVRRCFMIDAEGFGEALASGDVKRTRLNAEWSAELADRWAAYACRRGLFVIEDNAKKLASLMQHHGVADDFAGAIGGSVAQVASVGWVFTGSALERAGVAFDAVRVQRKGGTPPAGDERDHEATAAELRAGLEELRAAADAALQVLADAGL